MRYSGKRWSSRNRLRRKARWWIACLPRSWVRDFGLGCAHGSIVHQGGGLQELHIDQGLMPLPYPPYPLGSLIIWCYSDFSLADGGTYIVPGSHRSANGSTSFHDGVDLLALVDGQPGLVAICAPPGTCHRYRYTRSALWRSTYRARYAICNALSLQQEVHQGFTRTIDCKPACSRTTSTSSYHPGSRK